jgi:hypothetical protein
VTLPGGNGADNQPDEKKHRSDAHWTSAGHHQLSGAKKWPAAIRLAA